MKLTSSNFYKETLGAHLVGFYKASSYGVEECNLVFDEDRRLIGFTCGALFSKIDFLSGFDINTPEYFTEKEEAIESHRKQVIEYISHLNRTSLLTHPIIYAD